MAVGDIIQATFVCRFSEQIGLNVRHYRVFTQLGTGATLPEMAAGFHAAVSGLYPPLLNSQATFEGVMISKIFPLPPSVPVASIPAGIPGVVTGDALPRQVAGLLRARTAFAGRSQRGRVYVPFPSEASSAFDGSPILAYLSALGELGGALFDSYTFGTLPNQSIISPVIWHRMTSTFDLITSIAVATQWATQRRRGSFGRPNPILTSGSFIPIS
jgi:hypothetical protein